MAGKIKKNKPKYFDTKNPHAMYVFCDGAMDYGRKGGGGVGVRIEFPDSCGIDPIEDSHGKYIETNIERVELEALCRGMELLLDVYKSGEYDINVNTIILRTDRLALCDTDRTNPYKINEWRKKKWCNHEGKAIKNSDLLNKLDKLRRKVCITLRSSLRIEYARSRFNKKADKLSKAAKTLVTKDETLRAKDLKIARRLFDGDEIKYDQLNVKDELNVHIYKKEAVGKQYEISAEICHGDLLSKKIKIYSDYFIYKQLKRKNKYIVRINAVGAHHINIYKTIKKFKS